MDAKCKRIYFSVHNMITKLVGDKHNRWPDLLGTVALAYNATVHSTTCYSPHELFYSFASACPLDTMLSVPVLRPGSNADKYALQALERLQEAAAFVRATTGKQIQQMKKYYDTPIKPQHFVEGVEILVFHPKKKRGHYSKWQVSWKGPMTVKWCFTDTNYMLQKLAKSRPFIVHIDHMRCFPNEFSKEEGVKEPNKLPTSVDSSLQSLGLKLSMAVSNATAVVFKSEKAA